MKGKALAWILSCVMAVGILPMTASADAVSSGTSDKTSDTAKAAVEELADNMQSAAQGLYNYSDEDQAQPLMQAAEETCPSRLDLRDVDGTSYVTPVKFQNPFGTCWGFAAISAAETSILGSGLAAKDGYDADSLDLSEKHLTYFAMTALDDPSSSQNGEGIHAEAGSTASDRLDYGGRAFTATSLFSSGIGPNLESRDPLYRYQGAGGFTEKRFVDGEYIDYCFSSDDDWSLPEADRFKQSYVLKESYILPSPAVLDEKTQKVSYDPAATAAIKEQLMNKRAVQIGYNPRTWNGTPETEGQGSCISENWAQYVDNPSAAGHAVCIVGWDDNYPVTNFLEDVQPPGPGAWLVKNSWGSGEVDPPNKGDGDWGYIDPATGKHTGYFWLSYYDQTIATPEAIAFDKSNVNSSYDLDQHDYMPVDDAYGSSSAEPVRMANVFKADVSEQLEQVSCQTTKPDTTVTWQVYLLKDKAAGPTDGKLMATETAAYPYGGYHKVSLSTPVIVQKGQHYSIVVTQQAADGKYTMNVPTALGKKAHKEDPDGIPSWSVGVINPGESFLLAGDNWMDLSDKSLQRKLIRKAEPEYAADLVMDNFPIKGYAREKELSGLSMYLDGDTLIQQDMPEAERTLELWMRGDAGKSPAAATRISWELGSGGSEVFELKAGKSPVEQIFIPRGYGTVDLYVTAEGLGTIIVSLESRVQSPSVRLKAGKKKLTVHIESVDQPAFNIQGTQIRYRMKGTSKWKVREISGTDANLVLKKLKKGKKYQVRARYWFRVNGEIQYGPWSNPEVSKKIK